jgi:hypothetical protein
LAGNLPGGEVYGVREKYVCGDSLRILDLVNVLDVVLGRKRIWE